MKTKTTLRILDILARIRPMNSMPVVCGILLAGILGSGGQALAVEGQTAEILLQVDPAGARKPEILIEQPLGTRLVDGKSKRSFGTVVVGQTSKSKIFKIRNVGNAKLTGLRVAKAGLNVADFKVGSLRTAILAGGSYTIFKVQFTPKGRGSRVATLRVFSNDADENPFDIKMVGEGVK